MAETTKFVTLHDHETFFNDDVRWRWRILSSANCLSCTRIVTRWLSPVMFLSLFFLASSKLNNSWRFYFLGKPAPCHLQQELGVVCVCVKRVFYPLRLLGYDITWFKAQICALFHWFKICDQTIANSVRYSPWEDYSRLAGHELGLTFVTQDSPCPDSNIGYPAFHCNTTSHWLSKRVTTISTRCSRTT